VFEPMMKINLAAMIGPGAFFKGRQNQAHGTRPYGGADHHLTMIPKV